MFEIDGICVKLWVSSPFDKNPVREKRTVKYVMSLYWDGVQVRYFNVSIAVVSRWLFEGGVVGLQMEGFLHKETISSVPLKSI